MSPNQVAQWFADNPGSWFAFLDELRAVASDEQLIMLADDLQYMVRCVEFFEANKGLQK